MRPITDMDNIQIEILNACHRRCGNCTRFCGHQKPFFMDMATFKNAIDSMIGYPKMTGIMGGEPLLHPLFEEFCDYAISKIPREQLGLWSCFPEGKEKYREVIVRTFGNIFLNDHSRDDIYHAPILVAAKELCPDEKALFMIVEKCWLQNSWSASINPKGAFFCEIAASMSVLFGTDEAWKVEPGWWTRIPKDFTRQMEEYCTKCGCAFPLKRRLSTENTDDISPENLERLKGKSMKVDRGEYQVHDLKLTECPEPMAAYKDPEWRQKVAAKYGIFLTLNDKRFHEPHLKTRFDPDEFKERKSIFQILQGGNKP